MNKASQQGIQQQRRQREAMCNLPELGAIKPLVRAALETCGEDIISWVPVWWSAPLLLLPVEVMVGVTRLRSSPKAHIPKSTPF
jgi:hypothetical protein